MDRAILQQLIAEAESLLHRGELDIARQREMVRTLKREGHDVADERLRLRRLETRQARHIADRNRLIKELGE
jgi:hypothetical protein